MTILVRTILLSSVEPALGSSQYVSVLWLALEEGVPGFRKAEIMPLNVGTDDVMICQVVLGPKLYAQKDT